jgi:predicted ATPase
MEGKRFLRSIRLKNLLSYGSEGIELDLQPLNVLIGPNNSGKSNLIEVISILAAAPEDFRKPIREGGGVEEWLWKGTERLPVAELEVGVESPEPIWYRLAVTSQAARLVLVEEEVGSEDAKLYSFQRGEEKIYLQRAPVTGLASLYAEDPTVRWDQFERGRSVLSQIRDPILYPQLTYLGRSFGHIHFYRSWSLESLRKPQPVDLPEDFLLEKGYNLGLILNDLQSRPATWTLLLDKLRLFYERVETVTTKVQGGTIQILFHEKGLDKPIPATRLSDGTLHYLCLLAILCHPEPPPLICIEEPEVGLHFDALHALRDLLVEASRRTQLIVTTHSDILVSALSEVPESVVVCERTAAGTQLQRLEPTRLEEWLERYRLGDLWTMGHIGGTK